MNFKKNDIIEVDIDAYGSSGEGIAHPEGCALFVQGTLVGERVRVLIVKLKKTYGYGKLLEVIQPSSERVIPICPVADKCGGCDLQHMSYEEQLRFKKERVCDCLTRIGGVDSLKQPKLVMESEQKQTSDEDKNRHIEIEVLGCEKEPSNYRNKAQFPVSDGCVGFYAARSHRIIEIENCSIQQSIINNIKNIITECISVGDWLRHIYIRYAFATEQAMVCLVVRRFDDEIKIIEKELKKIKEINSFIINYNLEDTNVILGDRYETIYGTEYIEDMIGDIRYRISPGSFYQVNPYMTEKLYDKALEYAELEGGETVWDLYCGIGTISLFLAKRAKQVIGVEVVPEAIKNAKENAELNNIENAEFICGTAEDVAEELAPPDVIVVDPPRKGCDEKLIHTIGKYTPSRIIYVSCDPATLARDIARLKSYGYELDRVCVVDQFWQSKHVETVVQLVNIGVKPDYTVRVDVDVDEMYKTIGEDKRNKN